MQFFIIILVIITLVTIAVGIFCLYWLSWMLPSVFFWGAPYVPTSKEGVEDMIKLAELKSTDKIVDLGSGDGRIVIAAARVGVREALGYEIDPRLIRFSRREAMKAGVGERTKFFWKSMWKADLHDVDVVFLYQITYAMKGLAGKLKTELPKGARVVSSGFQFPEWEPEKTFENIRIYKI